MKLDILKAIDKYEEINNNGLTLTEQQLEICEHILKGAADRYYNNAENIKPLTDIDYDRLKNIYLQQTGEIIVGSPPSSNSKKVKHSEPMLMGSLENVYSVEEAKEWIIKRIKDLNKDNDDFLAKDYDTSIMTSIKYDGCSVLIEVENDKIIQAYSRGQDGIGEDFTDLFEGWELPISFIKKEKLSIKCECIMLNTKFEKYNETFDGKYANSRTAVSGILSRKDRKKYGKYLTLVLLDYNDEKLDRLYRADKIKKLVKFYKENTEYPGRFKNIFFSSKDFSILYNNTQDKRNNDELVYMADGVVIEFINDDVRKKLGFRDSDGKTLPKYSVALKFHHKSMQTILNNIEYDVSYSNSGRITPVAMIEPVTIDNKIYKRVSLSNFDRIRNEDFKIGGSVILSIRGDVLGYIERNPEAIEKEKKLKSLEVITSCPICRTPLKFNESQAWLLCPNDKCPRKITGKILNFFTKMRIKNIAVNTIEKLIDLGFVESIVDFYELFFDESNNKKVKKLEQKSGFGEKSVQVIKESIEEKLEVFDYELLAGMNWPSLGRTLMKNICKKYTIDNLLNYSKSLSLILFVNNMVSIDGIDTILAKNLYSGLNADYEVIELLKNRFLKVKSTKENTKMAEQSLTLVVTGNLANYKRDEFKDIIEGLGHKLVGSISKKTDYLITNDTNSGTVKNKKATELGVKIINEQEAIKILGL
jgi:DNA ligase (NAD+)